MVNGNPAAWAFLRDTPRQIEELAQLIATGDWTASGHQAHKIKGAAANVGGEIMRDIALKMELAGKVGDGEAVKRLEPALRHSFAQLQQTISVDQYQNFGFPGK